MFKRFSQEIKWWLGVFIGGLSLGLILQFAQAWTEPTQAPPGGNLAAPINTGSVNQYKNAGLALYGNAHGLYAQGPSYGVYGYETDTGAYGLLGYSGYGGYFNGPTYTNSYSYSTIMYDSNNTGYYVDPNSNSWLYRLYSYDVRADILYDRNNTGYYLDPNSTSRLNYGVFDNVYSYGWMQSQIFYDANNNGYYLDPNSTSRLNYTVFDNSYVYGNESANYVTGRTGLCIGSDCRTSWPGQVTVQNTSDGESYYPGGGIGTKVSIDLSAGTWIIVANAETKPTASSAFWQWRLRNTTDSADLMGCIGNGCSAWEQETAGATQYYKVHTMSAVYSISSGTKRIELQFGCDNTNYPIYARRASIMATKVQ